MSDSESIVFYEQTEIDSFKSVSPPRALSETNVTTSNNVAFNRPPLHTSGKHVLSAAGLFSRQPAQRDGRHNARSAGSHSQTEADGGAGKPSRELLSHENLVADARNCKISGASNIRRAGKSTGSRASSIYCLSEGQGSECGNDSIHFVLESSGGHLVKPGAATQLGSSSSGTFFFQIEDDGKSDLASSKANASLRNSVGVKSVTLNSFCEKKEANTRLMTHVNEKNTQGEAKLEEKYLLDNFVVFNQAPHTGNASAAGFEVLKKTESTSKEREIKNTVDGPHKVSAVTPVVQEGGAVNMQSATSNFSVAQSGGRVNAKTCVPATAEVNTDDALERFQNLKNNSFLKHAHSKKAEDDVPASPLESPRPRCADMVPKPIENSADTFSSSFLLELDDLLSQARLFTEHWHLFNEFQRKEIAHLIRKVAEARSMDNINDNNQMTSKGKVPLSFGSDGVFPHFRSGQQGHGNDGNGDGSRRTSPHVFSPSGTKKNNVVSLRVDSQPTGVSKGRGEPCFKTAQPPGKKNAYATKLLPAKERQNAGCVDRAERTHNSAVKDGVSGGADMFFRLQDVRLRDGVARFARSLGVLWPPKSRDELFFMTGTRLTPQQRDEFYEAVTLQMQASKKLFDGLKSMLTLDTAKKKKIKNVNMNSNENNKRGENEEGEKGMVVACKKPQLSRTSILREAFDLMDIDQKGVIHAADLAALRHLLEAERQQLCEVVRGGGGDDVSLPVSFLARTRKEQRLLKGTFDPRNVSVDEGFGVNLADLNKAVTLYSFLLDVILPYLCSSGFVLFDFATVGLLLFGSMRPLEKDASPDVLKWRQTALHYFEKFK